MSYENAKATALFATKCLCCGRALVDAVSVETGVGPVCRQKHGYNAPVSSEGRTAVNALIHEAALNATTDIRRIEIAGIIESEFGFDILANKIRERFMKASREGVAVTITKREVIFGKGQFAEAVEAFVVQNQWADGFADAIKAEIDWRDRTVLRDENGKFTGWAVRPEVKRALWDIVKAFFAGETGVGPNGPFVIA